MRCMHEVNNYIKIELRCKIVGNLFDLPSELFEEAFLVNYIRISVFLGIALYFVAVKDHP